MAPPKTVTLNDGNVIPWLGFGTGTALYQKDAEDLVRLAIETGITHLDGAQVYDNEQSLGAGIKASGVPREEIFLVTKLNNTDHKSPADALEFSLKALETTYLDLCTSLEAASTSM